jgi:hypothetical protein
MVWNDVPCFTVVKPMHKPTNAAQNGLALTSCLEPFKLMTLMRKSQTVFSASTRHENARRAQGACLSPQKALPLISLQCFDIPMSSCHALYRYTLLAREKELHSS